MCYNAAYSIEKNLKHAISREQDPNLKRKLEDMLENWRKNKLPFVPPIRIDDVVHFSNAFEHAFFPAFYLENGERQLGFFRWGLIPRWCKDEKKALTLWNQTINARSETMFDKPSFRASAKDRRCVIILDGFYEYHHIGKDKYPFFIEQKGKPMYVAGLYELTEIDGVEWRTFTIVTCDGNERMKYIHNNPKNPGRMPVILDYDQVDLWLNPRPNVALEQLENTVTSMCTPLNDADLNAYTVGKLQGKHGIGNDPRARERFTYLEVELEGH